MGECYWHGYEIYPGHPCEECEREKPFDFNEFKAWASRSLADLQGKNAILAQQGKIDFRKRKEN